MNRDEYTLGKVITCIVFMAVWLSVGVLNGTYAISTVWQHALAFLFGWFVLGNMVLIPILRRFIR
jgi:hypothetical protein